MIGDESLFTPFILSTYPSSLLVHYYENGPISIITTTGEDVGESATIRERSVPHFAQNANVEERARCIGGSGEDRARRRVYDTM